LRQTTVSIVVPAKDEEKNIKQLLARIWDALVPYKPELKYEVVVVDDSTDRTAAIAKAMRARIVRGRRKGLGQAIIDGINASKGDIVVVMDADGSHDPGAIPSLIKPILNYGVDMTIGSRYIRGAGLGDWSLGSKIKSIIGSGIMSLVTGVRDSNSGFFAFRREVIEGVELKPSSWKIMLEILFRGNITVKREVPIVFGERWAGRSKNNPRERMRHAWHLLKLLSFRWGRFINFALIGGIGALWYFGILYALTEYSGVWYGLSAAIGTLVAVTNNYFINHYYTFRHVKQYNRSLFRGWLKYLLNSAIGDGLDWLTLVLLTEVFGMWYMLSALLASGVALVVKYTIASKWIWGAKGRKANDADYEWHSFYHGLPWQKRWKQKLAGIVRDMVGEAGSILDVGCGSSPLGVLISHTDYIGIDPNGAKIRYMESKKLWDCLFVQGSLDDVAFTENGCFDTILFIEVIEHLDDMDDARHALNKIHRLLKDGGQAIVATPNYGSWTGRWMDRLYGVFQKGAYKEEHKLKFTLGSLKRLCAECGLIYCESKIPSGADMVVKFRK
jgi:dolichol-phosphate mannosyltransferase